MRAPALALACAACAVVAGLSAQQPPATVSANAQPAQPRFRAGANLVRVDAYITADGVPVTDLTARDFEVLEDNVPQRVESFELVRPRGPAPSNALREPGTVAESRDMARDPEARVFVLFLDIWHVQASGSYRAQGPITRLMDRVIGQDDMIGVMTPDMSPRDLTLARRRETVAGILKDHWYWGERNAVTTSDPREQEIERCYPDVGESAGLAREVIARRRIERTLDALRGLIVHLENVREDRKFVFLLSEGWLLRGPDTQLARPLKDGAGNPIVPAPPAIGVDPQGRLRMEPDRGGPTLGACDRERSLLAFSDQSNQFEQLIQRANRVNISFYPVDARGLVVFDEPIGPDRPPPPAVDAARLASRQETLRTLALNTDGEAVLNTNTVDKALERIVADTGAYYLLGYYSTNTRLDGRFRRLKVRVKREGVEVRARPGYLAPTEAELASTRVDALMNGAPPGHTTIPPIIMRAFDRLAPARAVAPLRLQTAGAPGRIWVTAEVDPATMKSAEWRQGGNARLTLRHERGAVPPFQVDQAIAAGQATFTVAPVLEPGFPPGRYVVQLEIRPTDSAIPLQTTSEVTVPETTWLTSGTGLVSRRGPATGLAYVPTADPRFRRTERLRFEVPRAEGDATAAARLLGRDGLALNVGVTLGERVDSATGQRLAVADVTLAPLAQGEYVLEVSVTQGDRSDSATFAFRIVP